MHLALGSLAFVCPCGPWPCGPLTPWTDGLQQGTQSKLAWRWTGYGSTEATATLLSLVQQREMRPQKLRGLIHRNKPFYNISPSGVRLRKFLVLGFRKKSIPMGNRWEGGALPTHDKGTEVYCNSCSQNACGYELFCMAGIWALTGAQITSQNSQQQKSLWLGKWSHESPHDFKSNLMKW